MDTRLRQRLIEVARRRGFVSYGEVAAWLGIDTEVHRLDHCTELFEALGEVSAHEVKQGRPMLSVVVGHADDKMPGSGFFGLARDLGLLRPGQDQIEFYVHELDRVWDHWSEERSKSAGH